MSECIRTPPGGDHPSAADIFIHYCPEYFPVFFLIGLVVVMVYAWDRFNEPTFPDKESLPRTVDPFRYLFLKSGYPKARRRYVILSVLLYCLFVAPGPFLSPPANFKEYFPPQAWPLLMALILVGVVPHSSLPFIGKIDNRVRSMVHAWFLVPMGSKKTISILEDSAFKPPAQHMRTFDEPQKKRLLDDLANLSGERRSQWARTVTLMESLRLMHLNGPHPLVKRNFEPFKEDYDAILVTYEELTEDIEKLGEGPVSRQREDKLTHSVDSLLRRIYVYISWGIRYQADSDREVNQTLVRLGFDVAPDTDRRLFDIVVPMVLAVMLISLLNAMLGDVVLRGSFGDDSVKAALSTAMAASMMYGGSVWIALHGRSIRIGKRRWSRYSPERLVWIAVRAGLVTWGVIVLATVLVDIPTTWASLLGLFACVSTPRWPAGADWFLPRKIGTAAPWFLAGATLSVQLCVLLDGDIRKTEKSHRLSNAFVLGSGLAVAAMIASILQNTYDPYSSFQSLNFISVVTLLISYGPAGFACGAVVGFMVPYAFRRDLLKPFHPDARRKLQDTLRQAEEELGSRDEAANWVFTPRDDLDGITPAEAIRYPAYATGVGRVLRSEASALHQDTRPHRSDRPGPTLLKGGRSTG